MQQCLRAHSNALGDSAEFSLRPFSTVFNQQKVFNCLIFQLKESVLLFYCFLSIVQSECRRVPEASMSKVFLGSVRSPKPLPKCIKSMTT